MGNKKYFSNCECDSCNEHFSLYETSLSNYGGILNTFSRIKGKKGYAKHKGVNEQSETFVENNQVRIIINEPSSNENLAFEFDEKTNLITINTNKYSYTPIHALKSLVKIGFCMLDQTSLQPYDYTRKWLIEQSELKLPSNNPLYYLYRRIGGRLFPHPWAVLYKKRKEFSSAPCPTHSLLVFYGLFGYQIFLPGNILDNWIHDRNRIVLPIVNQISITKNNNNQKIITSVEKTNLSSHEVKIS